MGTIYGYVDHFYFYFAFRGAGSRLLTRRDVPAHVQTAKFLINQQKYLEALETQRKFDAMVILQQEIAPVDIERDRLNHLSR